MIAVGVDTHKERHYATALDLLGQLLGEFSFGATAAGYAELQRWAEDLGDAGELVFGIEGAGSWGAGLCEHLRQAGHAVLEVERPRRAERPAGKSDRIDALAAAEHVLVGEKVSTLRSRGIPSALRALLNVRRSTIAERTRLLNQLQALNVTAPVALRERIGDGTGKQLERRIMSLRARAGADVEERAVFGVMRDLAARSRALAADARRYEHELAELVRSLVHTLLDEPGIGPISAAKLLASDPARFKHEAAFARYSGTAPLPASSGKTVRHRLNRGGDRPSRQRHPHHRAHPRQAPTRDARLPRPPHQRGKDQARSDAGAQTPHLPRHLQTARRSPLDFKEASLTHDAGAQSAPAALLRSWRAAVTRPLSRSMQSSSRRRVVSAAAAAWMRDASASGAPRAANVAAMTRARSRRSAESRASPARRSVASARSRRARRSSQSARGFRAQPCAAAASDMPTGSSTADSSPRRRRERRPA
jgi:transposase